MITCKKCGGQCNPSKAILQYNKESDYEVTEKVTKYVDCYKCKSCGNSFIPKLKTVLQIIRISNGEVVEEFDVTDKHQRSIDRLRGGIEINLNHQEFMVELKTIETNDK